MIELRAQQVIIDAPRRESVPFVVIYVQRIIYENDNITVKQLVNREKMINKSLQSIAYDIYNYADPLQPSDGISGAGLGDAIKGAVVSWLIEEYPDFHVENGRVIKHASD